MKFLLTNDDGIDAPGLAALEAAARELGEVITVAPRDGASGCGHQTTTHRPLQLTSHGPDRYAIDGSPADCVRIALLHLATDIDWVLSGVNSGGNLGVDIYMSGTVAAVREGVLLGRPGMAFSQYRKSRDFNGWQKATRMTTAVLHELLARECERGAFWNVNFPDEPGEAIPPRVMCPVDPTHLTFGFEQNESTYHFRSNYHARPRLPEHDIDVCFSGRIAVSLLRHAF